MICAVVGAAACRVPSGEARPACLLGRHKYFYLSAFIKQYHISKEERIARRETTPTTTASQHLGVREYGTALGSHSRAASLAGLIVFARQSHRHADSYQLATFAFHALHRSRRSRKSSRLGTAIGCARDKSEGKDSACKGGHKGASALGAPGGALCRRARHAAHAVWRRSHRPTCPAPVRTSTLTGRLQRCRRGPLLLLSQRRAHPAQQWGRHGKKS